MATKKTTKKASAKAPAKKTAAKANKTTVKLVETKSVTKEVSETRKPKFDAKLPSNLINIVTAETLGTFMLTLAVVGLNTILSPLYAGIALAIIVLMIGAVSGAHVNPAVTFGLWTMRKLKTVLVPFYWVAQFLGAMAAVVLLGLLSNSGVADAAPFSVSFDNFMDFSWGIFALELVGMAIFMFGISAAISRAKISPAATAAGVGASLAIALMAVTSLAPYVQKAAVEKQQSEQSSQNAETAATTDSAERTYPREIYIGGATLNPAVALAVTEKTNSQLSGSAVAQSGEKNYTRLSLEVILATLIGAALGGNLFLLVNYRNKTEE